MGCRVMLFSLSFPIPGLSNTKIIIQFEPVFSEIRAFNKTFRLCSLSVDSVKIFAFIPQRKGNIALWNRNSLITGNNQLNYNVSKFLENSNCKSFVLFVLSLNENSCQRGCHVIFKYNVVVRFEYAAKSICNR